MFSHKTKFWMLLILTGIMGYFCIEDLLAGQYLWAIVIGIFTAWNLDSLSHAHKNVKIYYGGLF